MANHSLIYVDGDPSALRRLKAHIVEVGVASLSLVVGGFVAAAAIVSPGAYASVALAYIPEVVVLILGLTHVLAGVLVLLGLLITRQDVATEIHTEQFGWIAGAAGWIAYAWATWYFTEGAAVSVSFGVILGVVSALRAWFLDEIEEQARDRLKRHAAATGADS